MLLSPNGAQIAKPLSSSDSIKFHFIKIIKISVKKTVEVSLQNENNDNVAKIVITTDIEKEAKVSLLIHITLSCTIEVNEGLYEKNGKSAEADVKTYFYCEIDENSLNKFIKMEDELTKNDSTEKVDRRGQK